MKGLIPANPPSYDAGRIDVPPETDALPCIQDPNGPRSSITTVETALGHEVMGTDPHTVQVEAEESVTTQVDVPKELINSSSDQDPVGVKLPVTFTNFNLPPAYNDRNFPVEEPEAVELLLQEYPARESYSSNINQLTAPPHKTISFIIPTTTLESFLGQDRPQPEDPVTCHQTQLPYHCNYVWLSPWGSLLFLSITGAIPPGTGAQQLENILCTITVTAQIQLQGQLPANTLPSAPTFTGKRARPTKPATLKKRYHKRHHLRKAYVAVFLCVVSTVLSNLKEIISSKKRPQAIHPSGPNVHGSSYKNQYYSCCIPDEEDRPKKSYLKAALKKLDARALHRGEYVQASISQQQQERSITQTVYALSCSHISH